MKLKLLILLLLATSCSATADILPTPTQNIQRDGHFTLTATTRVNCDAALAPLGGYLHEYLGLEMDSTQLQENVIRLSINAQYAPEAYTLRILNTEVEITGGTYGGVFNGIQTLFQLLPPEVYAKQLQLPTNLACREVIDEPLFGYRGMMLDVARTWMDSDAVKRYINLLAYHKINKLHIHLADDEGWRIEIKSHPELTSIGGFRGGDSPIKSVYGKWGEKYGGFFTQDEMRALINYAAVRNIEIIPEIDLPGHSRNIAQLHPEILCNYTPDTTPANGYDLRSAWCVAREANYALLEDILGELCTLFPSPYIHVGGDEVKVSQWKKCPDCRALMRKLAITDARLLEDHFMERISKILQKHGKLPAVWNEAARSGKLTHQSRVHGWEHMQACLDATALGYPTIIMPASHFYFDMRQAPREEGHDWAAIFDAKKTYEFDFSTAGFSPAQRQHVVGLQGAFWSETYASHTPESPNHLDFLCFPRVCALAQIAWHGNAEGWNAFYTELQRSHYDRMAAMGICFRMFPPNVSYKEGRLTVTTSDRAADIFYTEEGDTTQYRYTHPITTTAPHRFLFHSHYKSGRSAEVAAAAYYRTITPAVKLSTSMGEGDVPYANVNSYKTFARTARACHQGDWIRYDFVNPVQCREIYMRTGNHQLPKPIVTTGYVEISYDGQKFERIAELVQGSATLHPTQPVRALRIISTCDDNGWNFVTIQPLKIKPIL